MRGRDTHTAAADPAAWLERKDRLRMRWPGPVKRVVRLLLLNRVVGTALGWLYGDRIPHRGSVIATSAPHVAPGAKAALYFGWYERAEIDQVCAYLAPDVDVVELGASIGANTVEILKRVRPTTRVVAVEPDRRNLVLLRRTLALNGLSDRVVVVAAAIDYSGAAHAAFAPARADHLRGRLHPGSGEPAEPVPCTTLGALRAAHRIGRFQLVCDIEGAEVGVLWDDADALADCVRILIEIDGGQHRGRHFGIEAAVERILALGFTLRHRHGNRMCFERGAT